MHRAALHFLGIPQVGREGLAVHGGQRHGKVLEAGRGREPGLQRGIALLLLGLAFGGFLRQFGLSLRHPFLHRVDQFLEKLEHSRFPPGICKRAA
ncbi:hypothetical protein [Variovorax sp. E3]|uniref:hypothetical protein n=1 Tax=Variovorax sp. E3 TaxID=1914993 RepID=UPI0018DD90C2|nr:hypothetical protein [Variovorax sp. E3]